MLRTIAVRSDLIKGTFRKTVINNITRTLAVEGVRRVSLERRQVIAKQIPHLQLNYQLVRCYSDNYPKHTRVVLPALSPTMEEGKIVSWAKKEGEKLNEGDLLAEIETDKATMAFETPEEGYLAKILVSAGTKGIPVGRLVCIIVENESDVAAFKDFKQDSADTKPAAAAAAPSGPAPPVPQPSAPTPPAAGSPAPSAAHTKVALPALSPTMEEGKIVSWAKKEGEKLSEGDVLAEIETDKATMAFETPEEGYLAKILVPAGTKGIKVGQIVCVIVENEGDVGAFKNYTAAVASAPAPAPTAAPTSAPMPSPAASAPAPSSPPPAAAGSARVYVSPMAKRLAEQRQIRLQGKGTGMFGSITSKDLEALAAAGPQATAAPPTAGAPSPAPSIQPQRVTIPAGSAYADVPITNMRNVIAKRLLQSKTTIPHYYLTVDICVDKLLALRSEMNKKLTKDGVKLSVNDFVIKACAMASKKVPEANSAWMDTVIRVYKNVDVSVAVSTPTGLITPIVFEANNKGIVEISKEVKSLAQKARDKKLLPNEYQGGTISVSNLGMFGVTKFDAIINPGQSCILAVGTTQPRLVEDEKSEKGFKIMNYMEVSLSCDHRVIDGAGGAVWLQNFKTFMENPVEMLMENMR